MRKFGCSEEVTVAKSYVFLPKSSSESSYSKDKSYPGEFLDVVGDIVENFVARFFFVGAIAGISNVIRSAKLMQKNND